MKNKNLYLLSHYTFLPQPQIKIESYSIYFEFLVSICEDFLLKSNTIDDLINNNINKKSIVIINLNNNLIYFLLFQNSLEKIA